MSTYIISDIHGCYKEFKQLLEKINFTNKDELYILGDILDRGPEPIPVLKDIMLRSNVYFIKGNHELMAMDVLENFLNVEITEESINNLLADNMFFSAYCDWMENGGKTTLNQFYALSKEEREDVMSYIEESYDYEVLEINKKLYILVHAGLNNFSSTKEIDEYLLDDILWVRPDYKKRYYPNEKIFLVTGHTPTPLIRDDKKPLVYEKNGHIAIDCGCNFGGRLAAYCLETGKATYVDSENFSGDSWESC